MCPAGETAKGFQAGGICQASAGIEEADETGPGEASGYSFEAVKGYFEEAAVGTMCEGAEVTVRKTDVMLRCPNCNELFVKKPLKYNCPHCGTPGNPTDAGKEMAIDFIETE